MAIWHVDMPFAASLVMTVTSYIVGQKYFPVKYDLKTLGSYLAVAVILYLIQRVIVIPGIILRIAFNTFLLSLFFLFIWFKEQSDLRRLFRREKG